MRPYLVVARAVALPSLLLALFACRDPGAIGDDDAPPVDAAGDAADVEGPGCSPRSPRAVAPETFVGPTGLQQRVSELIDGAQTSLDVAMYLFTVTAIADRIAAAHDRGVAVRVLFDPDHPGNYNVRGRMTDRGVPHRTAPAIYTYSHAKYFIVDGDTAVVMSMNFNIDAMSRERNYGFIDRDPDDVADLRAIFDMDWSSAGGEPPRVADLACTRLIVSPNNAKPRILELIERAEQTLEVEAIYIAEVSVREAIAAAAGRGVAVRIILESTEDNAEAIGFFAARGIPIRDAVGFYNHAKLLIADGVAFVGSENFSQTALTRNREVGALIFEPGPAEKIRQQFEADWAAGQ